MREWKYVYNHIRPHWPPGPRRYLKAPKRVPFDLRKCLAKSGIVAKKANAVLEGRL